MFCCSHVQALPCISAAHTCAPCLGQAPLDHASVTLDFKGEVKALVDMLHRAQKGLSMRFDVATTEKLSEMLSLRPTILHLVCHAEYDLRKISLGASRQEAFFLGFEDPDGALDQLSLQRLRASLARGLLVSTKLVFVSACHSQPAAEVFAAMGVRHVVAIRKEVKVIDEAAALFARHLYLALVQGLSVRDAFQVGRAALLTRPLVLALALTLALALHLPPPLPLLLIQVGRAALAGAAPSMFMPRPAEEADKFLLIPEVPLGPDGCVLEPSLDPHAAIIFPSLPAGTLVERNPLPYHEPPYVPKPFLGRSIELQRLVLMLGRRRNKEVRMVTLCGPAGVGKTCLARAAASHLYERRWFVEGCVSIELRGKRTEEEVLASYMALALVLALVLSLSLGS